AGKSGKSITLADEEYVFGLEPIETYINMKIPVIWPAEGELPEVEDKSAKFSFRDLVRNDEYSRSPSSGGARGRGGRPAPGARRSASPRRDGPAPRRDGPARPPRKAQGPRPAPAQRSGAPQQSRRPSASEHAGRRSGSKSYAEIQKLSLEERMSYYKQQYSNESGSSDRSAPNKPAQNRGGAQKPALLKGEPKKSQPKQGEPRKNQSPRSQQAKPSQGKYEPRKSVPPRTKAPVSEPVAVQQEGKSGFFARLFRKKK
ncbi:MAG: hypothetical protein PHR69_08355, partial [Sphaerochaeta sp.]|nr:hypothetical protein [Sphaerochaeta sp.]